MGISNGQKFCHELQGTQRPDIAQRIRTLVAGHHAPGSYQVRWDGRDQAGTAAASGIYLYRLRAGNFQQQRRLTLLK